MQGGLAGLAGLACFGGIYAANNNDLRDEGLLPAWPSRFSGRGWRASGLFVSSVSD